ncbi:MAG TPA: hypothetical protein VGM29_14220 [Polyangiaceae bacterium]
MSAAYAVIVDVPASEIKRAAPAISTCNKALGQDRCLLHGADRESAEWFAVVRFDDETQQSCSIELHQADPNGPTVATTALRFSTLDSADERWASAGVVVAALVLAQRPSPEPAPIVPPVAPPPPISPPPTKPEQNAWLRAEAGGELANDLSGGPWQAGGMLRLGVAFNHPGAFVLGAASYGARPAGSPGLQWLDGSLGFGAHVGLAEGLAALELHTEAVFESVSIEATQGSRTESARRFRVGPGWGLDGDWYFTANWALVAGLEASVLRPTVVIRVADKTVESLPSFGWRFISVVRYDLR